MTNLPQKPNARDASHALFERGETRAERMPQSGIGCSVSAEQTRRFAWLVVAFLFLGSVLNYVDRAVLGVVKPQIMEDLELTNLDFGWVVNAFLVAYMIVYVIGGRVADRVGCRRTFSWTLFLWSTANMLHAYARGFLSLCSFRALLGVGEAGYYPGAMRGAAEWFTAEERAKAIGIYLCGVSVGALIAPPLVAWIALSFGWRAAFVVTAALGFLLIPPWIALHRKIRLVYGTPDPAPAQQAEGSSATSDERDVGLLQMLCTAKYWCLLLARSLTDGAWYFFLFWMPGYFQDVRKFELQQVGQLLWIPYFAADFGALAGGWASIAIMRRGFSMNRARKLVLVPSALLGALGATAHFVHEPSLAIAIIGIALFGHLSWSTNIHTAISDVSPPGHVAILYGITGAAGTLMGAVTQPLIGLVVDLAGHETGYNYVFAGVGAAYLLAILLLLSAGRLERIRRPAPGVESPPTFPAK